MPTDAFIIKNETINLGETWLFNNKALCCSFLVQEHGYLTVKHCVVIF